MLVDITHMSKYLITGFVDEPCDASIGGAAYRPVPAFADPFESRFRFYLVSEKGFGNGASIEIRSAADGQKWCREIKIGDPGEAEQRRLLSVGLHSVPDWVVDRIVIDGMRARISGWFIVATTMPDHILVNGKPAKASFFERPDLRAHFGHLGPERQWTGFAVEADVTGDERELIIQLPASSAISYGCSNTTKALYPDASLEQIERVYGPVSADVFRWAGFSNYKRISETVSRLMPGRKQIKILDWGCGCGGTARYFLEDENYDYRGCDIDPDNLRWCKENLAPDRFELMPLRPPEKNPFATTFDVVFGISVISHLSVESIVEWMRWLSTLFDDGVVVLTTLSTQAMAKAGPKEAHRIATHGAIFAKQRTGIGRMIGTDDYYGTAFQMPDTLARLCPKPLRLTHHVPAGLSHQDIFVFQKADA